jgi:integrase
MYLTVFRHFMTQLVLEGKVREHQHPTRRHKNKVPTPAKKEFLEAYQVDRLVVAAERYMQHGVALGQLIRLLALSGMRKNEAMRLQWSHVDFEKGTLNVGMDGMTKNATARKVPLTFEKLRLHLEHMHATRDPFSPWLFPSPKRGDNAQHGPWKELYRSWHRLRSLASKPDPAYPEDFDQPEAIRNGWKRLASVVIHELRSHFISTCVNSGINYLTIARYVGHSDGGVLIGKVYGKTTEDQDREFAKQVQQPDLRVVGGAGQ